MTNLLNKITQGDCLEVMKEIPDKSVDMILCDLPYGTTRNKWDSVIPLDELWVQYERLIKENGAIVLTAQTPFDKVLGVSNLKLLKYEWVWEKDTPTGHLNAKKMPMKAHENILVFYKKLPIYNPQMTTGHKPMNTSYGTSKINNNYGHFNPLPTTDRRTVRYPRSVQKFNKPNNNGQNTHPTQKPVALFEYLIRTYTNEGEVVLDNCIGSGTTAVACINTGRSFIGIEREADYVEIANKRIEEARRLNQ
jgi:DNA modification methylase